MAKTSLNLDENIEGMLCYLLGFITGILFLILEKNSRFVKFHAMQSTITFIALFVVTMAIGWIPFLGWIVSGLVGLLSLILWIVLMLKAYQGQMFKLPVFGDIAEKQLK